jgi:hypothetical protein
MVSQRISSPSSGPPQHAGASVVTEQAGKGLHDLQKKSADSGKS